MQKRTYKQLHNLNQLQIQVSLTPGTDDGKDSAFRNLSLSLNYCLKVILLFVCFTTTVTVEFRI